MGSQDLIRRSLAMLVIIDDNLRAFISPESHNHYLGGSIPCDNSTVVCPSLPNVNVSDPYATLSSRRLNPDSEALNLKPRNPNYSRLCSPSVV